MMDDRDRLRELGVRPQDRHSSTRKGEMDILKGKVAVVTGSTSGIGLAYARAFAGAGANIALKGIGHRPMSKKRGLQSRTILV